jgi:murein DD-endopeptidase MepM/ murein hydrolase activator NlpD
MYKYNDDLIKKFNDQINENKKKQEELKKKQEELKQRQKTLASEYSELGDKLKDIVDIKVDEEEAIKVQEEIIKMYQSKGCKDNENIKTCGKKILPSDTKLWRPLNSGYISSNFGNRCFNGGCDYHTGIDMANKGGTPVYATANGTVAALTYKYSCGGNMIFIHHNINGTYYTSLYMHLRSINVSKGDTVTKNTIIGYVGGDSSTPWDHCTTGAHLHFTLLSGLVGTDYRAWSSKFYSKLLNPRNYVNIPKLGKRFEDRLTAY